jgi:hypothetical protein
LATVASRAIAASPYPVIAGGLVLPTMAPAARREAPGQSTTIPDPAQPAMDQSQSLQLSLPATESGLSAGESPDHAAAQPLMGTLAAVSRPPSAVTEPAGPAEMSRVRATRNVPTQLAAQESREGVVFLDGMRMGRWILDRLTRQASRPTAGTTSIDPRINASFPGAPTGM